MEDELFKRFGKVFPKGTILFREGDAGEEMYIIETGRVKIFKRIDGIEKVLAILGKSEFFGEMSLLNKKPRSANAEVLEDARILVINNNTFESMVRANPEIAIRIMRMLAKRLEDTNVQIANLMIKNSYQRTLVTLLKLSEDGIKTDAGILLNTDIEKLSVATGLETVTVKGIVEALDQRRLIELTSKGILIRNVDNLKRYLDYIVIKEQVEST
jgi:CRP-like cAMP-binding protein